MPKAFGTIMVWICGGASVFGGSALADDVWLSEHRGIAAESRPSSGKVAASDNTMGWSAATGVLAGPNVGPNIGRDERDRFFDIWLVERGRSPQLTRRLLGQ